MDDAGPTQSYRVLARKYRPSTFSELIGQEAMVRTLANAIRTGRLAHAFLLTGVRGVGKTTTARIIARALNCVGPDGQGGPTAEPCGVCEHCRAIAEDRHVDVQELDAASRTGVGDIRELIDGVRYLPVSARNKVYIVDEVHMLSRNAFNALLKTLEEPPEHVRFVFATTEVRKIPVTVLSRCQRFDLRRVDAALLIAHLRGIAEKEGATVAPEALALIARAAEGSVRDGLSLLDQAIAHGAGVVDVEQTREMLGLADRTRVFDLFDALMAGDLRRALDELGEQYRDGADPIVVLQDLLELVHWLTRIKIVPAAAEDVTMSEVERERGREMAAKLAMPTLARAWQMLLKGLGETRAAESALAAAEMVLVRLAYVADLPPPAEVVRRLRDGGGDATTTAAPARSPVATEAGSPPPAGGGAGTALAAAPRPEAAPAPAGPPAPEPTSYESAVALVGDRGRLALHANLVDHVHCVRFAPGRIEIRLDPDAPAELPSELSQALGEWTGRRWMVTISDEPGAPTLREQAERAAAAARDEAERHPLVRAVMTTFPGATIRSIDDLARPGRDGGAQALNGDDER